MNILTDFLSTVPDVIWAAVVASALTFAGVLLTNRHFSKQQREQLRHDADQNEAERKFTLRESVYLATAEHVTIAYQQLANISNIDLSKINPAEKLDGFFLSVAKASLVASDDTSKAIGEFVVAYSGAFFKLIAMAIPVQDARVDRNLTDEDYQQHQNEVSRILASMTQFNEEAKADSEVWRALNQNLEFNMQEAEKAAAARNEAWTRLNSEKVAFLREVLPAMRILSDFAVPALVAMRSELGISTDIEGYRFDLIKRFEQVENQLEELIGKLSVDAV